MSTRKRPDPAQRAAMAAAREITKNEWDLHDSTGEYLGIGTIARTVDSLALCLIPAIRRALRKPRKGAKR